MGRLLKFRAWDKRIGKMTEDCDAMHGVFENLTGNQIAEEQILMQYTGLLDKNGKEIYEGDVVNWGNGREIDYVELKDNDGWKMRDLYNIDWWEDAEVIGNIHENPELLKE